MTIYIYALEKFIYRNAPNTLVHEQKYNAAHITVHKMTG